MEKAKVTELMNVAKLDDTECYHTTFIKTEIKIMDRENNLFYQIDGEIARKLIDNMIVDCKKVLAL